MNDLLPWDWLPVGERAIVIRWRGETTHRVEAVRDAVRHIRRLSLVAELVPGIASVLVCYDPLCWTAHEVWEQVKPLLPTVAARQDGASRIVEIPVRYGGDDGPDLVDVAQRCGLSPAELIALHTARSYPVQIIGFMPGFPYLGDLPPRLHLPRRSTPRTVVPAGSVAIANGQTGIYPNRSPGGWHLLGRTPVTLFDPFRDPPSLLGPGDMVRFVALEEAS